MRRPKQRPDEHMEVAAIFREEASLRAIREGYRMWSSGELLQQGITRQEFERSMRELEETFFGSAPA